MSDRQIEASHAARDKHLFGPGPKRILSLDGGGVRGAISVAFLERIEELLVEHMGPKVRLGDWFDLIGGTSTGAIIAGALALGHRASEVKEFYLRLAPKVFRPSWRRIPKLQAKFDAGALRNEIESIVGGRTLDSPDLITGLALVTKRIDTGSPWILANNRKSIFWDEGRGNTIPNKDYLLTTLFRASTAAPTYFDPEIIAITKGAPVDPLDKVSASLSWVPAQVRLFGTRIRALYGRLFPEKGPSADTHGLFIDGGVTPYNNPAMLLLMMVTLKQFGLCWEMGPKNLTIVSIGTGDFRTKLSFTELSHFFTRQLTLAERAIMSCIGDGQKLALAQMQWLGECPIRWPINREILGLEGNCPPGAPWFRFMRYDVALDPTSLLQLGRKIDTREATRLQSMDDLNIVDTLYEIGCRAAKEQIRAEHRFGGSDRLTSTTSS
jgi:hypothetical protein